jgi:phosphoribosylanthranilate isomerase
MIIPRELDPLTPLCTSPPKVKICGITTPQHALAAVHSGADMIGIVFAPSRRQVSVAQAKTIRAALDSVGSPPMLVGVFVNETTVSILDIASEVRLDIVQLSGDETSYEVAACIQHIAVIKALRFPAKTPSRAALDICKQYTNLGESRHAKQALPPKLRLLIDTYLPGEYGGTGQLADWTLASALSAREEIILAGGLNPQNVTGAKAAVRPWGVDVSSGVERDGVKDDTLIEHFVRAAQAPGYNSL